MRLITVLVSVALVVILVLAVMGIVSVQNNPNDTSIKIDKKELKEKTQEAVDRTRRAGSEGLEKMGKALNKAGENLKEKSSEPRPADASTVPNPEGNRQPGSGSRTDKSDSSPETKTEIKTQENEDPKWEKVI